ncbi:ThiF family adenylyltransferase [Thauera sp. SWB20]|uniref:ThiF family adenylyltransferase n=1 Tax=Thauera sp. SWB20 TaxID=1572758 RepID=UPI0005ADFEEC|nr:ThiF family adenylyltransferase [Thauera sp. SWB20]KIN89485.1 thiF family protein [Thauera sp. SWB20]
MSGLFAYEAAFSRNLGWVTQAEQAALRGKRIAIAGMGGVGGGHLLTLARLGVGSFSISDFDTFDLANFNRQAGAFVSSLGRPKVEVLAAMAADINPECELRVFGEGVSAGNLEDFLGGADLYVDALDFFAFDIRRAVFAACHRMGIPAVTAAPLGLGAAVLVFQPDGMSFEEYFQLEGCDEEEMAVRFLIGLSPAMLQFGYLADPSRVNLGERRGPSTVAACQLCSGLVATESLKILLGRGGVRSAPRGYQFDAYRNRLAKTWRPGGNRNPFQRFVIWIARRQLMKMKRAERADGRS